MRTSYKITYGFPPMGIRSGLKKKVTPKMRAKDNTPVQFPEDGKTHIKWDENLWETKNFKANSVIKETSIIEEVKPKSILKVRHSYVKQVKVEVRSDLSDTDASSGRDEAEIWKPMKKLVYPNRLNTHHREPAFPKKSATTKAKRNKSMSTGVDRLERIMLSKLKRTYGIPISALY
jgi:hypothetical protein